MKTEQLIDCEGITLESAKPFAFSCCDCGLTHHMVIVSEDGKPVGFAVKRVVDGKPRMAEKSQMNLVMHLLRNPYGYSAEKLKWARLAAADLIEALVSPRHDAPTSQINPAPKVSVFQYARCTNTLRLLGKPYPRTCAECGLGPCKTGSIGQINHGSAPREDGHG